MTSRIGPGGVHPIGQAEPVASIEAIAHTRQQAGQPSLASLLGKSLQAQVLARLDDGSFVVRMNAFAARMPLPAGTQVGSQLPLTLVALTPRPVFQLQTGEGNPMFTEAGPAPGGAAVRQDPALLWIEGRSAAAPPGAGAEVAHAALSPVGKLLGEVVAAAQRGGAPQTAAVGHTPLLGTPGADAGQIAAALRKGLEKSGLFYESHVAEWAQGARPQAELAAEPQARGMAAPSDPATAQLINLQLHAHEQAHIAWQGQLWPGQDMRWEVERQAPQNEDAGRAACEDNHAGWQSNLTLRFGGLGEIAAKVVLSGGALHIRLDAPSSARNLLEDGRGRLADALDAAGTPLHTLAIHGHD